MQTFGVFVKPSTVNNTPITDSVAWRYVVQNSHVAAQASPQNWTITSINFSKESSTRLEAYLHITATCS
jgi:hypothetical protein